MPLLISSTSETSYSAIAFLMRSLWALLDICLSRGPFFVGSGSPHFGQGVMHSSSQWVSRFVWRTPVCVCVWVAGSRGSIHSGARVLPWPSCLPVNQVASLTCHLQYWRFVSFRGTLDHFVLQRSINIHLFNDGTTVSFQSTCWIDHWLFLI